jgi:hypothetical protein
MILMKPESLIPITGICMDINIGARKSSAKRNSL